MFARIKILMTNTSTPYHRGDMMNASGHGYATYDKRIYQLTQDARKTTFSYPQCIGYHACATLDHCREKEMCKPNHGLFVVITMVPNACN